MYSAISGHEEINGLAYESRQEEEKTLLKHSFPYRKFFNYKYSKKTTHTYIYSYIHTYIHTYIPGIAIAEVYPVN